MTDHILLSGVLMAALSAGVTGQTPAPRDPQAAHAPSTTLQIPTSLKVEHEELHGELSSLTKLAGKTGAAAQRVATLLHEHFVKEEEFALPPLALLAPLASGRVSSDMRGIIALTDRLKADLSKMLDEHKAIVGALGELARAGKAESHPEAGEFAAKLTLHAQHEEQVLYPAALLVGEYLKVKLADRKPPASH